MKAHLAKVAARRAAQRGRGGRRPWPRSWTARPRPPRSARCSRRWPLRGETEDEVVGFARTMRARAVPLPARRAPSTPAAPAATAPAPSTSRPWPRSWWPPAACRWPSTATARRAGAAAAPTCSRRSGVRIDAPVEIVQRCARRGRAGPSSSRPRFHAVDPPRRRARARSWACAPPSTCSGPLTNPARPVAQVVGVPRPELTGVPGPLPAAAWACARAWVVHGVGPRRAHALAGPTRVAEVRRRRGAHVHGRARGRRASRAAPPEAPAGRRRRERTRTSPARCWPATPGPRRDVVLLNAAAALLVAGRAKDLTARRGAGGARPIDDGRAARAPASASREASRA